MKIFFTTEYQGKRNSVSVSPSDLLVLYCITLSPQPVGVQCPITSPLGEFPGYWDWLRYPGRVGVHRLFPFAFHISVLFNSHSSPALGFHQCFFFMADVSVPIR